MGIVSTPSGYRAECPDCSWTKEYDSETKAEKGLGTHQRLNCSGEEPDEPDQPEDEEMDGGQGEGSDDPGTGESTSDKEGGWMDFPLLPLAGAVLVVVFLLMLSGSSSEDDAGASGNESAEDASDSEEQTQESSGGQGSLPGR